MGDELRARERELKKRWAYDYRWGRVQNDRFDAETRFVYRTPTFDAVLRQIEARFARPASSDGLAEARGPKSSANPAQRDALLNYALNRWYNFWSARAIEDVFCTQEGVTPSQNRRNRLVDFAIQGVAFDHKTSVFPRGFGRDLSYAVNHPAALIAWLYEHQSRQQRRHFGNRLFLVLYAPDGAHWKLKAELTWLSAIVRDYVRTFDPLSLHRFHFTPGQETRADVIWAIRC